MTQTALALFNDAVHVWEASLDAVSELATLSGTLAEDERVRASRFHFAKDRNHFVAARGLLRTILARYLGAHPAELRFSYGGHGKPMLSAATNVGDLRFNLTHSRGLALYAVARGRELGVDLEYTDAHPEEGIAERFFSPREAAALRGLPPPERREAFFACWTRKEAYLKARGDGLALHLDRFDVSGTPTGPAAILYPEGYRDEERWSLTGLAVPPPYAAALCVEGCLPSVTYRQWT